jgi:hypothetical protein
MAQIAKQYTTVTLEAGYANGPYGVIFTGNIAWFERGKESTVDTVMTIHANEADIAQNQAVVNDALPPGNTHKDVISAAAMAMAPYGVTLGYVTPKLDQSSNPRSRVVFGMARDVIRDITRANQATAFISDGKLNVVKEDEILPHPAIILNSQSGMIGIPSQHMGQGVQVTSLLNPAFKQGCSIRINQDAIMRPDYTENVQTGPIDPSTGLAGSATMADNLQTSFDGSYKVLQVVHHGDNRGTPWFSELTTQPALPVAPQLGVV